ncbi:hypothetical protein D1007_62167 [Hordeum vulgare]|nr:hypothetical protein D1007_62167 [Hordeum vulgare]
MGPRRWWLLPDRICPPPSLPRDSPAFGSSVVLETPPAPVSISVPCVLPPPPRRVRFNVPDLPADRGESYGVPSSCAEDNSPAGVSWAADWELLPPPPPSSMRSASVAPTTGSGLAAPGPRPTVAIDPTMGLMRVAAPSSRLRPSGSSGGFTDKLQLQHAEAIKEAFKLSVLADPPSGSPGGTNGQLQLQRTRPIKEAFKFSSWQMVKPAHWWCKQAPFKPQPKQGGTLGLHSRQSREAATHRQKQRNFLRGITCYRCRAKGHYSSECRDPVKCCKCSQSGHRAWECKLKSTIQPSPLSSNSRSATSQTMPRSSSHRCSRAPGNSSMGGLGDPESRPRERYTTFVATPAMEQQATLVANNAVVLWLGGSRSTIPIDDIIEEIHVHTRVEKKLFELSPLFPEDYMVRFVYPHHGDLLTTPGRFGRGRLDIHASKWWANAHVDVTKLCYHVHLSLDYVLLHGWDAELISDLIGDDCILHYFDSETTLKKDASAVKL